MNESVIAEITGKIEELSFQERIDLVMGINVKAALVIQKLFPGVPFVEDLVKQKTTT